MSDAALMMDAAISDGDWPAREGLEGPLRGLKVLDLSRILAGPFATMLLADLGADVIKVESLEGDATRNWGPPFVEDTAVYYFTANRNKRSIALDMKNPDDLAVVHKLIASADVVVENLRQDSAERFGLSYEQISSRNDRAVVCTITGFARGTAREHDPAYDLVVQAAGGMMGITGIDGLPPVKVGVATADLLAGLFASTAILSALVDCEGRGRGRHIEVPLMDVQVSSLANQSLNWLMGGMNPERMGSDHPNVVPAGAFPTKTGYIVLTVGSDDQFDRLLRALEQPQWRDDPRFATNIARVAHRHEVRAEIEAVLVTRPASEWLEILRKTGVPAGVVRDVAEVFQDPDIADRLVSHIEHPRLGKIPQVISPIRLDGHSLAVHTPPPDLGADTEALRQALGSRSGAAEDRA